MATTKVRYNQIKTGLPAGGDVNYNNVSLLLNMEGSNGSTTFTDSSSFGHGITANGNASISTSEFKFGSSSAYFDGSGDYLITSSNSNFSMGALDFTWEAWVYVSGGSGYRQIFSTRPSNGASAAEGSLAINPSGGLTWYTHTFIANGGAISGNTWHHVAIGRSGTSLTVWVDGLSVASATNSDNLTGDILSIGANNNGNEPFTGYIEGLRITKGVARYTSSFSVPTAAFPAFESKEGKRLIVNANESIELES